MKTDWAWFDDAHEESHDEYHVADRGEILGHVAAWLDRFLARPDPPAGPAPQAPPDGISTGTKHAANGALSPPSEWQVARPRPPHSSAPPAPDMHRGSRPR